MVTRETSWTFRTTEKVHARSRMICRTTSPDRPPAYDYRESVAATQMTIARAQREQGGDAGGERKGEHVYVWPNDVDSKRLIKECRSRPLRLSVDDHFAVLRVRARTCVARGVQFTERNSRARAPIRARVTSTAHRYLSLSSWFIQISGGRSAPTPLQIPGLNEVV